MMTVLIPCLIAAIAVAVVLGIGVVWGLSRRAAVRDRPAELAAQVAAFALPGTNNPVFYQGDRAGRAFLLTGVTLTNQAGRSPTNVRESIRLVVRVELNPDAEVIVFRRHDRAQFGLESFEAAFDRKNEDRLTPTQQAAMLDFVRRFEGGLRLRPRAGANEVLIPSGVWGNTGYILVHDRMTLDLGSAEVEAALAGLEQVAVALEVRP